MSPDYTDEIWKRVRFDGISDDDVYFISNYGRIKLYKPVSDSYKILKCSDVNGYRYFSFKSNVNWKVRKTKSVHRLVAEAFCVPKDDTKNFVIHLDFDKSNNHFKNLKWVDQEELTAHNKTNPKVKNSRKKGTVTNQKLTETDVIRLKKKLNRGKNKYYKLAKEFGITHTQLNRIRKGENWGHIKVDEEDSSSKED